MPFSEQVCKTLQDYGNNCNINTSYKTVYDSILYSTYKNWKYFTVYQGWFRNDIFGCYVTKKRWFRYLHFLDTLWKPSTEEKYRVALSKVSATVVPSCITRSTITLGSIFKINFSCFFFCFFISCDFFSTLRANTCMKHCKYK